MKKILIVDDEPQIKKLLPLILTAYSTRFAESVDEALEILKNEFFDLIITDKKMPGKSGRDLIRSVKKKYSETPIILMTGEVSTDTSKIKVDCIEKPFSDEDLLKIIEKNISP